MGQPYPFAILLEWPALSIRAVDHISPATARYRGERTFANQVKHCL